MSRLTGSCNVLSCCHKLCLSASLGPTMRRTWCPVYWCYLYSAFSPRSCCWRSHSVPPTALAVPGGAARLGGGPPAARTCRADRQGRDQVDAHGMPTLRAADPTAGAFLTWLLGCSLHVPHAVCVCVCRLFNTQALQFRVFCKEGWHQALVYSRLLLGAAALDCLHQPPCVMGRRCGGHQLLHLGCILLWGKLHKQQHSQHTTGHAVSGRGYTCQQ